MGKEVILGPTLCKKKNLAKCILNMYASEHNRRKGVGFVKLIRSSKYILVHSDFHYSRINVDENHKINTRNEENELKVVEIYFSLL